jgi:hypothetical protein
VKPKTVPRVESESRNYTVPEVASPILWQSRSGADNRSGSTTYTRILCITLCITGLNTVADQFQRGLEGVPFI